MPLAVGTRLGPYEILAPIGAGGMGEVYRATDTRLRREVAVKVSAERFSERFEREARAVAALNHPNICTLHDVGPDYLVMELVEGQTLAERIRQGPMPLEEALLLARQIADALEAAHEKGIVHRDLKPGNVKIRPDETVKVLDFGLAKVGGTPAIHSQDSPTMTVGPTEAGVILGTAAYMAPEQAKGKAVDKRADIWAFGVVLYEMLTGEPLFHGETATEVLAAVIKDPPRFDRVPPQAQALLRRCLEKDPKRRLRDIGDAMPLLEAAPPSIASAPPQSRLWPALAGFFCIVSAALAILHFREKPPAPPDPLRLQLPVPQQIARVQGANALAVSPDGRQVAFYATEVGGGNHLWIRALDTVEVRPLPGTAYGPASAPYPPVWSPDGRFLAFESLNKLKKIDLSSGVTQDLCEVTGRIAGGSWNPGGVIVFGNATGPLMQVPADGGPAFPLTVLDAARQDTAHILPAFLPDGLHFLYTRISKTPAENGVYLGSLDAKPVEQGARRIAAGRAVYAPSPDPAFGYLLSLRGGRLLAQRFATGGLESVGDPVQLAEGLGSDYGSFSPAQGALVYRTTDPPPHLQPTWFDRRGKELGTVGEPGQYLNPSISHDGSRVAITRTDAGNTDIWLLDPRGSMRFTFDPAIDRLAQWSPDDTRIAFGSNRNGAVRLYVRPSSGAAAEELLADLDAGTTDWSRDGKFLMVNYEDDQWLVPLDGHAGERKPIPFVRSPGSQFGGRFSPDGRWIAYLSNESGRNEIYVVPFEPKPDAGTSASKFMISKGALGMPRWRADGKEMYYLSADGTVAALEVTTTPVFHAGPPRPLFAMPSSFLRTASSLPGLLADAAPDGQRFLFLMPVGERTPAPFTVVVNWTGLLKK